MTIKIEIEVPADMVLNGHAGRYMDRSLSALGYARVVSSVSQATDAPVYKHTEVAYRDGEITSTVQDEAPAATEEAAPDFVHRDEEPKGGQYPYAIDYRAVGSASEGKARRTKNQISDDAEFEKLAAEKGVSLEKLNKAIAEQGRDDAKAILAQYQPTATVAAQEEPKAAISTGEERVGPDDAQDAADEAAETEKTGLAPIDVLRRLVGDYQKKHGMPAAVKLCQDSGLIGKPIHELDDAGIEAAIAAMQGGAAPAKTEEPAPVEEHAALEPKTREDLMAVMMKYGQKFDGTSDQKLMAHTMTDMPKIFAEVFGPSVTKLSEVPTDRYAEAVAVVEAAIEADPYGRAK